MYGKQRVLYPMKRIGERGSGKWERITWDQATREIAERFLHHSVESGPSTISFGSGTQMGTKLASAAAHSRFCNITGVTVPEFFSGVGDSHRGGLFLVDGGRRVSSSAGCLEKAVQEAQPSRAMVRRFVIAGG